MLNVLHAADLHLDAAFSSLPSEQAAFRRAEQRALLTRLSRLSADLVLLSGDVFDTQNPYRETLEAVCRAFEEMAVPIFLAPGNHDFFTPRGVYARHAWPGNVHIFTGSRIEPVFLPALGCAVYGSAFTAPFRDDDPLTGFCAPADGLVHLMCLHGDVSKTSRYGPISPLRIAESGLHYLALGHMHAFSGVQRAGGTVWAYPGCAQGRGFDETGEKGALLCRVDGGGAEVTFVPLGARRYEVLSLPADANFEVALPAGAQEDIYRILLTGESGPEGPDLAELSRLCAARFFAFELLDRTRLAQSVWARSEEEGLTGHFLRALRARAGGETAELAARFGLSALEGREDPFV